MGAHYLTDTVVGFAVSLGIQYLVCALILGKEEAKI